MKHIKIPLLFTFATMALVFIQNTAAIVPVHNNCAEHDGVCKYSCYKKNVIAGASCGFNYKSCCRKPSQQPPPLNKPAGSAGSGGGGIRPSNNGLPIRQNSGGGNGRPAMNNGLPLRQNSGGSYNGRPSSNANLASGPQRLSSNNNGGRTSNNKLNPNLIHQQQQANTNPLLPNGLPKPVPPNEMPPRTNYGGRNRFGYYLTAGMGRIGLGGVQKGTRNLRKTNSRLLAARYTNSNSN